MCGIVAAIAERNVLPVLLEGLHRLEYRGYDSAGVALNNAEGVIRYRAKGKVEELEKRLDDHASGSLGIAHTRWATHGVPAERNSHPHVSGSDIALVHNGIIENHEVLRQQLIADGYIFTSETDSEVIAHLVAKHRNEHKDLLSTVQAVIKLIHGAYALAVIEKDNLDELVVVRSGSPLVIGLGLGENFIASDQLALLPVTNRFVFLEEGDSALITRSKIEIFCEQGKSKELDTHEFDGVHDDADKGEYRHFMKKEIHEQPTAITNTIQYILEQQNGLFHNDAMKAALAEIEHIQIVACGTSYHSGMVARYWLESYTDISCQVEVASEYRYRKKVIKPNSLLITISQSGETADTLAALRNVQDQFLASIAICNVEGSSLSRESQYTLLTQAGPEIGVASTKAFTTQLCALYLLVLRLRQLRSNDDIEPALSDLRMLPNQIEQSLLMDQSITEVAALFADKHHTLFLGRGIQFPIAQEGALKLKEISYIHAEAYPAGELKHGPLALVDEDMPIVSVAPADDLIDKLKSNLEEVRARGGQLIIFADKNVAIEASSGVTVCAVNEVASDLAPILYCVPLQLLSYHVAVIKGTDVDQPRNLAKSVTVE